MKKAAFLFFLFIVVVFSGFTDDEPRVAVVPFSAIGVSERDA